MESHLKEKEAYGCVCERLWTIFELESFARTLANVNYNSNDDNSNSISKELPFILLACLSFYSQKFQVSKGDF